MKKTILTLFLIGAVKLLLAQTSFMKIYGNKNFFDRCYSGVESQDSGFVLAGIREDSLNGAWYISVIKTDKNGNVQWQRQYDAQDSFDGYIVNTSDGGYAILGHTYSSAYCDTNHINSTMWEYVPAMYLIKTDMDGIMQWEKVYKKKLKRNEYVFDSALQQTSDNGYILLGTCFFDNPKIYLVKTNSIGDTLWTKLIDNNSQYDSTSKLYGGDDAFDIKNTLDRGFIIMSWSQDSVQKSNNNVIVMRTDSLGNELWRKKFNNTSTNILGRDIQILARTNTYLLNIGGQWKEMDDSGNVLGAKPFPDHAQLIDTLNGYGYICAQDYGYSIKLSKYDISGNSLMQTQWYRYGSKETYSNTLIHTKDGGYAIIGYVVDSINDFDYLLIKTDSLGRIGYVPPPDTTASTPFKIAVYPNPATDKMVIYYSNPDKKSTLFLSLYDAIGRIVIHSQTLYVGTNVLPIESLASEMYFYRIFSDTNVLKSGKIVFEK